MSSWSIARSETPYRYNVYICMCVCISGIARLSFSFVQARSSNVWTMITSDSGCWIDFRQNKNCRFVVVLVAFPIPRFYFRDESTRTSIRPRKGPNEGRRRSIDRREAARPNRCSLNNVKRSCEWTVRKWKQMNLSGADNDRSSKWTTRERESLIDAWLATSHFWLYLCILNARS